MPGEYSGVTVAEKANVYFGGKVISHSVTLADGTKKTLGVILPGSYSFNTAAPERMDITFGKTKVRFAGESGWKDYAEGSHFNVAGNSSFEIAVDEGHAEYVCSFG